MRASALDRGWCSCPTTADKMAHVDHTEPRQDVLVGGSGIEKGGGQPRRDLSQDDASAIALTVLLNRVIDDLEEHLVGLARAERNERLPADQAAFSVGLSRTEDCVNRVAPSGDKQSARQLP